VKAIDDYMIAHPNDDMNLIYIKNNGLDGRVNEFYRSLGNLISVIFA